MGFGGEEVGGSALADVHRKPSTAHRPPQEREISNQFLAVNGNATAFLESCCATPVTEHIPILAVGGQRSAVNGRRLLAYPHGTGVSDPDVVGFETDFHVFNCLGGGVPRLTDLDHVLIKIRVEFVDVLTPLLSLVACRS